MDLSPHFSYNPTPVPGPPTPAPPVPPPPVPEPDYGPLQGLVGAWKGSGFNVIWRPNHGQGGDRFLELNSTIEEFEVDVLPGSIANRGFLQDDLFMAGVRYLQQVTDANADPAEPAGLHAEPGVWLNVPATTDPAVEASVARMASIPHGTTMLAQGIATTTSGPPTIPASSISPFTIGNPAGASPFPEQTLTNDLPSRTSGPGLTGIHQAMLDNPNSVLVPDTNTVTTVTLTVSSDPTSPVIGGGTANTAFLAGGPDGPNALAARVDATFWLQTRRGETQPGLLQYSQVVLLNFNGISWPHVTVGNLTRQPAPSA